MTLITYQQLKNIQRIIYGTTKAIEIKQCGDDTSIIMTYGDGDFLIEADGTTHHRRWILQMPPNQIAPSTLNPTDHTT